MANCKKSRWAYSRRMSMRSGHNDVRKWNGKAEVSGDIIRKMKKIAISSDEVNRYNTTLHNNQ